MAIKSIVRFACLSAGLVLTVQNTHALTINGNFSSSVTADMKAGFQQAANYWSSILSDNITITIDVQTTDSPGIMLASGGSYYYTVDYTNYRSALTADRKSAADYTAVSHLPSGSSISFSTNSTGNQTFYTDNNASANNNSIYVVSPLMKALGFQMPIDMSDGTLTYNSVLTSDADFDRSNGIDTNKYDFVGVTIHEIGHVLGFYSGADTVDLGFASDTSGLLFAMDLFRYGSASELQVGVGGTPYFSIDGGATNLGAFSTGALHGDGSQASHWDELTPSIGIMDPMVAPGELMNVTPLDLTAFDVIGYDLATAPEPTTLGILALAAPLILRRRKN